MGVNYCDILCSPEYSFWVCKNIDREYAGTIRIFLAQAYPEHAYHCRGSVFNDEGLVIVVEK